MKWEADKTKTPFNWNRSVLLMCFPVSSYNFIIPETYMPLRPGENPCKCQLDEGIEVLCPVVCYLMFSPNGCLLFRGSDTEKTQHLFYQENLVTCLWNPSLCHWTSEPDHVQVWNQTTVESRSTDSWPDVASYLTHGVAPVDFSGGQKSIRSSAVLSTFTWDRIFLAHKLQCIFYKHSSLIKGFSNDFYS